MLLVDACMYCSKYQRYITQRKYKHSNTSSTRVLADTAIVAIKYLHNCHPSKQNS